MSDALDRLAPEDKKDRGMYRHSAEGRDDMPVSSFRNMKKDKAWKGAEVMRRKGCGSMGGSMREMANEHLRHI